MLNLRFMRLVWGGLVAVGGILAGLLLIEYRTLKAQTALLSQLQTQYQNLNQQLTTAVDRQQLQLRIAEKKSAYSS